MGCFFPEFFVFRLPQLIVQGETKDTMTFFQRIVLNTHLYDQHLLSQEETAFHLMFCMIFFFE